MSPAPDFAPAGGQFNMVMTIVMVGLAFNDIAAQSRLRYGMHIKAFLSATLPGGVSFSGSVLGGRGAGAAIEILVEIAGPVPDALRRHPVECRTISGDAHTRQRRDGKQEVARGLFWGEQ